MRTLYVRIVALFALIVVVSGILALFVANFYYASRIRGYSEQKATGIADEIRSLLAKSPDLDMSEYLSHIGGMGFQIYAVNDRLEGEFFGAPFKKTAIDIRQVQRVLDGETYQGLLEQRHWLAVTGFFENSVENTVGLPVTAGGQTYAWFVRPNLEQQIGEVRVIVAVLLGFLFLFSIAFILIFSRYIVKPVKKLTAATNEIVGGNYELRMDVSRRDEIGDLARHFTQMARSLKQLDDMRQEFVANVSHEIQSPLTSIQGFAEAILSGEATPAEERRYLQIIEEESRRLSSLSKQLLTLAALDKEAGIVKRTAFRLDEQIRQVLIVTERQWSEKSLTLEPDLPETSIAADAQLLHQVWLNLLANAIKFSPPSGTIGVAIQAGSDIAVTVSNTGAGIAAEHLPHLFDRFYKADSGLTRSGSGSGLGLSIVRKIVELHGGTVEAHSEPGQGTRFTVRLPC